MRVGPRAAVDKAVWNFGAIRSDLWAIHKITAATLG